MENAGLTRRRIGLCRSLSRGSINDESPPNQDRDVNWPLRLVTNEDNSKHYNHEEKCDCWPIQSGVRIIRHPASRISWMQIRGCYSRCTREHDCNIPPTPGPHNLPPSQAERCDLRDYVLDTLATTPRQLGSFLSFLASSLLCHFGEAGVFEWGIPALYAAA
jgi:hypothetical protein